MNPNDALTLFDCWMRERRLQRTTRESYLPQLASRVSSPLDNSGPFFRTNP
jgi:hypothetical protein